MAEELNFNESYEKITTKTPVHADNLNKIFDLLLENDKFLKYTAESIAEKMLEKGMIANNLVTDNAEMVLAAPMGKELKRQLDEQNNNIDETYKLRGSANTKNEISNIGTYEITKDVPFPDTDYVAVSFGRKGYHWNFPVLLFNNWGDSVPLRMFTMKSSDGINYTPSDYKQIITNSDINVQKNTQKILLTTTKANVEIGEPNNTYYIIRNDYCFVSLSAIKMTSIEGGNIFYNLPKPVGRVNFTLHAAGGDSKPIIWGRIDDTAIFFNNINSNLIGFYGWGSFCYPIAK